MVARQSRPYYRYGNEDGLTAAVKEEHGQEKGGRRLSVSVRLSYRCPEVQHDTSFSPTLSAETFTKI